MLEQVRYQYALLTDGWAQDVTLMIDAQGVIASISVGDSDQGVRKESEQKPALKPALKSGALLPGLSNLHSHAHQRAMAGLAERSGDGHDSFWTWRMTMYTLLEAFEPEHLYAVASQLYLEMLCAGYTHVAEFQYLHHQANGRPYDNPAEMTIQTLCAAQDVGIGMTCLPVHYQFSGLGGQPIERQQKRFFNKPDDLVNIISAIEVEVANNTKSHLKPTVGVAGHSLRATDKTNFQAVLDGLDLGAMPIHMHIAEQTKEVEDVLAWSGQRPVEYCLNQFDVNEQWCLVHATHMTKAESGALANSGAVVGLCPTTEANLGDGFFDASPYLSAGGAIGIGSDSHCSVSPVEELRWLEYGQRLRHRSRNQLNDRAKQSTGRYLFDLACRGGAQACGTQSGSLQVGQRADFIALDCEHPILFGRAEDELIDSWIFSGNNSVVKDVYVGGRQVVEQGRHVHQELINERYREAIKDLGARC